MKSENYNNNNNKKITVGNWLYLHKFGCIQDIYDIFYLFSYIIFIYLGPTERCYTDSTLLLKKQDGWNRKNVVED